MWHIDEIVKAVKGIPLSIEREFFTAISTDSRSIQDGDLFIPLSGNNFDGHAFIPLAYDKSHGGSLCEKGREDIAKSAKGTIILVDNTLGPYRPCEIQKKADESQVYRHYRKQRKDYDKRNTHPYYKK